MRRLLRLTIEVLEKANSGFDAVRYRDLEPRYLCYVMLSWKLEAHTTYTQVRVLRCGVLIS